MPLIEMYVPAGTLSETTRRALHERVSRQVMEAEGATYGESPRAQAITWMLIHEMPAGSWSIGSEILTGDEGPRVLTRVNVPHGSLNDERRGGSAGQSRGGRRARRGTPRPDEESLPDS